MGIWERLEDLLERAHRRTLGAVLEILAGQRQRRNEAAFSIALIALSAKMAKADGIVTDDEIDAFAQFFSFPPEQAGKVRMIYQLAQQDVAGFDEYVSQVERIFSDAPAVLEDVVDCLYYVALADGVAHPRELELLERACEKFALSTVARRRLQTMHLGGSEDDPWAVLGIDYDTDQARVKAAYRALVRDHHPDALMARGVPADLIRIGEGRMAAINTAYEQIMSEISVN